MNLYKVVDQNGKQVFDDLLIARQMCIRDRSKSEGTLMIWMNLLNMAVLLSANLGVMNLLPLPALDGGRLVFLVAEAIRRKPVNRQVEGMIHFAGLMLLMALMVIVMYNDILKIF